MDRNTARTDPIRRDGVEGGGTQRQHISTTGETRFGPVEATPTGREAYKDEIRKCRNEADPGVGGGHSTDEPRENRGEGRAATSIKRPKLGKATGMPPRGKEVGDDSKMADEMCGAMGYAGINKEHLSEDQIRILLDKPVITKEIDDQHTEW